MWEVLADADARDFCRLIGYNEDHPEAVEMKVGTSLCQGLLVAIVVAVLTGCAPMEMQLVRSTYKGDTDAVAALLAAKVDVNARDDSGNTSLMAAASRGYMDIVEMLLSRGADVNARSHSGMTALMFAAQRGNFNTARMLLAAGANVNARNTAGNTALMYAAQISAVGTTKLLLAAGADVNAKDGLGETALMRARKNGHDEIVSLLSDTRPKGNRHTLL